jgi:hypothetical protein
VAPKSNPCLNVRVFAIPGVPVEAAVGAWDGSGNRRAYVVDGFPLDVRAHPLHVRNKPSGPCGRPEVVRGTVAIAPGPGPLHIRTTDGEEVVRFRASARLRGLERAGLPYVPEGIRVEAAGRRCAQGDFFVRSLRRA